MSEQLIGFYFSCNEDKSAHDKTIYVEGGLHQVAIGARYKNAERNSLYEITMDAHDLLAFGNMCINHARCMEDE